VNPAHGIDRQRDDVIDVAAHQPFEAVADADDIEAVEARPDRRGADDAVDAWSWTTADENGEPPMTFHT
jgi:hypothetical protein